MSEMSFFIFINLLQARPQINMIVSLVGVMLTYYFITYSLQFQLTPMPFEEFLYHSLLVEEIYLTLNLEEVSHFLNSLSHHLHHLITILKQSANHHYSDSIYPIGHHFLYFLFMSQIMCLNLQSQAFLSILHQRTRYKQQSYACVSQPCLS